MVQKHTYIFLYIIYIKHNEQSEKTFCGAKKKSLGHPFKYSQLNILSYVYQCKNRKKKKIDKQNMIWFSQLQKPCHMNANLAYTKKK